MQGLEAATRNWRAAVVFPTMSDGFRIHPRLAVFLFDTPRGFVWVEPSYNDPWGSPSPADHAREAPLAWDGTTWNGTMPDGEYIEIAEYEPAEHADLVGRGVEGFERYLRAAGRTLDEERERVRQALANGGVFDPVDA
jgi:hypothetical protein